MGLFYDDVPAARDSKAYASYLETIYGDRLLLDDALIEEDLRALSAFASRARGGRILDAGCGTGDLLRLLCAENDADGVGMDVSASCLAGGGLREGSRGQGLLARVNALSSEGTGQGGLYGRLIARERAESGEYAEGRLRFRRGSIEEARGIEGPFDLIIAVDCLEECADPRAAVGKLLSLLGPSGALMIAHTERLEPGEMIPRALEFSLTKAALALRKRNLRIRGSDLSRSERLHWRLSDRLLDKLREECAAEGNEAVWERAKELTEERRSAIERDGSKRYWYCVEFKGGR
jgi:SAM-dependent methyltransferase